MAHVVHLYIERVMPIPHVSEHGGYQAKTGAATQIEDFTALALVLKQVQTVLKQQKQQKSERELRDRIVDCVYLLYLAC